MTRLVEVTRPLVAGDTRLERGEIVDAGAWRNLQALLRTGYIRDAPASARKEPAHANTHKN